MWDEINNTSAAFGITGLLMRMAITLEKMKTNAHGECKSGQQS
jgi:hypothetical protein